MINSLVLLVKSIKESIIRLSVITELSCKDIYFPEVVVLLDSTIELANIKLASS